MVWLPEKLKNAFHRHAFPAAVFIVGLVISAYAYVDYSRRTETQQLSQLADMAKNYEFLLRRQLDQYASANSALGAFFSASSLVLPADFDNYIHASQGFARLRGLRSFGYLPQVPATQVDRFEAEARTFFPNYRVHNRRKGGAAYFPLLYGKHATNQSHMDQLLGFDYSAIPDRWAAMQEAYMLNHPVATRVHPSLVDPGKPKVLLIFSPVRKLSQHGGNSVEPGGVLEGFIYSTVYIETLFRTFDNGRLAEHFDLEVFEERVSRETIIFDGDGTPHALEAASTHKLAHRAKLEFANRTWLIYFYASKASFQPASARSGSLLFAIGLLLTLIASYSAAAWSGYQARKRALLDFKGRFGDFFAKHPFAVGALDGQHRFTQVNEQMARELGVRGKALIGTTLEAYIDRGRREDAAMHFEAAMAGNAVAFASAITAADGRRSDLSIVLIPMIAGDKVGQVLSFAENITDRKSAEKALYESRQMLQVILDNIPQSVFWKDRDSVYEGGNRAFLETAGLKQIDELIGKTDSELRWRDQAEQFRRVDLDVVRSGVSNMRTQAIDVREDGTECWLETSKIPLKDDAGMVVGLLAVSEDITARKYMEQELFRRANFDSLTGLPNRAYFHSELAEAVKRARRHDGLLLMYFDIDRFKEINDTYGHAAGDDVIRLFAQRVHSMMRETDFLARLGGDEFVLIAEALNVEHDGILIAEKLVETLLPVFDIGAARLHVTASIGTAYFQAGMTPDMLLKAADEAMYDAKRAGRNCFRQARDHSAMDSAGR